MTWYRSVERLALLAFVLMIAATDPVEAFSEPSPSEASPTPPTPSVISREFFSINGLSFLHYRDSPDATATAERRMELIQRIGASADRGDLWWGVVEPKPGVWDWKATDWLFDFFEHHGTGFLPILAYNEAGADHSPATAAERERFAEYCRRAVSRYKGRGVVGWEVWNEPNIPTFWKPRPNVEHYVDLLKAAHRAIKSADPQTTVVGGALNMTDVNYLEEMAMRGALDHMDVLSIHPYSLAGGPEEMDLQRQLQNCRAVLAEHGRRDMPVWITEVGWHSHVDKPDTVADAAAWLLQTHVIAAAEGIGRLFWFNVEDWLEGAHTEAWGFLTVDGNPKRTADAYDTMLDQLTGARFEGYYNLPGAAVFVFSTEEDRGMDSELRGAGSLAVAWALSDVRPSDDGSAGPQLPVMLGKLELPVTDETLRRLRPPVIMDMFGDSLPAVASHVTLTTHPVYVRLQGGNLFSDLLARRPEPENLVVNGSLDLLDDSTTKPRGWHRGLFYGGQDQGRYGVTTGSVEASGVIGNGAIAGHQNVAVTLSETTHAVWQSWPVPCLPGEEFTATARVRIEEATGTNGIQLQFFTGPGWGLAEAPASESVTGTTDGWTTATVRAKCPQGAGSVRVNLLSRENKGMVAFDEVTLTRL